MGLLMLQVVVCCPGPLEHEIVRKGRSRVLLTAVLNGHGSYCCC